MPPRPAPPAEPRPSVSTPDPLPLRYGTHWNFFFTLAIVGAAVSSLPPVSPALAVALGSLVLACHHFSLTLAGVGRWVEGAPRDGWLSANKEGVASLPGYLALALLGDAAGAALLPRRTLREWRECAALLGGGAAAAFVAATMAAAYLQPASRRLCNLPYVLWTLAQTLLALCLCLLVSLLLPDAPPPPLTSAASRSSLVVFLAANCLTGAVNLTLPTVSATDAFAAAVLTVYVAAVCGVAEVAVKLSETPRPHTQ